MKTKKILCPIDFSPCSAAALEHASELAVANDCPLVLAHVIAPPPTFVSGIAGYGPLPPYQPEPDGRLEATEVACNPENVERVHLIGLEGETIVDFADQNGCDLIVMGTHGYGGVAKFFMGSVADFVLRHANSKVIVVRDKKAETVVEAAREPSPSLPQTIAVAPTA